MVRLLLFAMLVLTGRSSAFAQDQDAVSIERPFLWEFQSADSNVVSYLFGTIHVNDPNITKLHPAIQDAFQSAQAVWFEIDFVKDSATQTKAISLPPNTQLKDLVSEETIARIDRRLTTLSPFLSRTALPRFRIVMWPMVLANLEAQVEHLGVLPMDMQLQIAARDAKKQTGGLEDASSQLKPLMSLPLDQQIAFLEASLDVMDEDEEKGVSQLKTLVRLYAAGDGDQLQKYLEHELRRPAVSDDLKKLFINTLLMERNQRMAKTLDAKVKAAPDMVHFAAVGTAHLLGEGSVIDELREAGYTVRRVDAANGDPQ